MSRATLYVGGLQPDTRAARIGQEFERFGTLIRCDIPTINGLSKGFGFVEFTHSRDADAAFRAMQGADIEGKHISIEWAKEPEYMRGSRPRVQAAEPPRPSMRDDPRMARHDDRHDRYHDIPRHVDLPRHDMSRHDPYSQPLDRRDDRDRMRMPQRHDDRIDDRAHTYPVPRAMEPRYPLDYARGPPPINPRGMDSRPPLRDLQREPLPSRDRMDPRDSRDNRPRVSREMPRDPLPQSRNYPSSNAPPISRPIDRIDRPRNSNDLSRSDGSRSSRPPLERNGDSRRDSGRQQQSINSVSSSSSSRQVEDNKRKSSTSRTDSSRNSSRSLSQAKDDESRKRAKAEDKEPVRQSSQDEGSEVEEIEVGQRHASQEEGDGEYQDDGRDDEEIRVDEESQDS
jgi:RNA recognition motif-containing protein